MSCAIAASTFSRVAGRTLASLLMTRETVINDTPAARATSLIVGALLPRRVVLMLITFTLPRFAADAQCFAQLLWTLPA